MMKNQEPAEPGVTFTEPDVDTSFPSYEDYYEKTDWGAKQVQPDLIYQLFSVPEEGEYKTHA
jgi:hypothetical protein